MAGPIGHHLAKIDIEHDAAEIEQQRIGGIGRELGFHASRLQNPAHLGNGRSAQGVIARFRPNPALKPARELC
jgi:hypothetical protein